MLVLSRKSGQKIRIGNDISLVITKIEGSRVRIGIEAPQNLSIQRHELFDASQHLDDALDHALVDNFDGGNTRPANQTLHSLIMQ